MTINKSIEHQARALADYNKRADPMVSAVYWFPNDQEVRLVIASSELPASASQDQIHPFYYYPTVENQLDVASAIALISAGESGKLRLPADWGTWQDAVEI